MSLLTRRPKPVVLLILDGFGIAPPHPGNAVANARKPAFDRIMRSFPHCLLNASGSAVGLPHGVAGNSEVGHLTLGAGKVVFQTLPRINMAIENGAFYDNPILIKALDHCKANHSNFHIMGCVSTGQVHSSLEHLFATLQFIQRHGFDGKKVFIHAFTDGRDTDPKAGRNFLEKLKQECNRLGIGRIVSIIGRYFAMDRNNKWDRTKKAYDLIVHGIGEKFTSVDEAISTSYSREITDEFVEPTVIVDEQGNYPKLQDGDALFFFNYRADRAIQLSRALIDDNFNEFERVKFTNLFYVGMTQYEKALNPKMHLVFEPENVQVPVGRVISEAGMRQLRLAETEKFAHVTFFFNGGRELVFDKEDRILVPSPKVPTYDMKPEMSTYELTQVLINKIRMQIYDVIIMNIACPDMVGHTGNYEAAVKAIEAVDRNLDRIILNTLAVGGAVLVTADHGNADVMIDLETGKPHTEHTTNPVPFIYVGPHAKPIELPMGSISDIAPTLLRLLGLPIPVPMSLSRNLLEPVLKN